MRLHLARNPLPLAFLAILLALLLHGELVDGGVVGQPHEDRI